jgi:glycosyltransferase involved in cell wall biosynthesis
MGWATIRKRWETHLPAEIGAEVSFFHVEDYWRPARTLSMRTGHLWTPWYLLAGRAAARDAIARGCSQILVMPINHAGWLPAAPGLRTFVYLDATVRQFARLYAGREKLPWVIDRVYAGGFRRFVASGGTFLCMSPWCSTALADEYGVPARQRPILRSFVDTGFWAPLERPPPATLSIVFIGASFEMKGGSVALEVSRMEEFSRCRWHFVTRNPPDGVAGGRVTFHTGLHPDTIPLRDLVRSCDLLVLPTLADCSPLALIEAASCGLPAIATSVGGIGDIVEDGVTGTLLRQSSANDLAAALRPYVLYPSLARRQGAAARARVLRLFDLPVHFETLRSVLHGDDQPT